MWPISFSVTVKLHLLLAYYKRFNKLVIFENCMFFTQMIPARSSSLAVSFFKRIFIFRKIPAGFKCSYFKERNHNDIKTIECKRPFSSNCQFYSIIAEWWSKKIKIIKDQIIKSSLSLTIFSDIIQPKWNTAKKKTTFDWVASI